MILNAKLGLFVLFILTTSFVSADDDDETTTTKPVLVLRPIPKKESDDFVVEVNNRRRSFAKEHNIANMHEVKWSQHLVDLIDADAKKGTIVKNSTPEKTYQGDYDFNNLLEYLDKTIEKLRRDLKKGSKEKDTYWDIVYLSPVHREIGCTETFSHTHYVKECYLEPGALVGIDFDSWEAVQEIVSVNGEPGSKCYERYGNNDGLCSLLPPTTPPTPTTPTPKPKPTQPQVPEKQTSEETESEESGSSTLVSFHSGFMCILFFQLGALF